MYIKQLIKTYAWNDKNLSDPVQLKFSQGNREAYPLICPILKNLNIHLLQQEFKNVRDELLKETGTYLKKWFSQRNIPWEEAREELASIGFEKNYFRQFNIMQPLNKESQIISRWTHFKKFVGPYTKKVIRKFKAPVNRARYSIAQPGWKLLSHIDYPNPKRFGFRVHIPIYTNKKCIQKFYINNQTKTYQLKEGFAWFMNVSYPHSAINFSLKERVFLTLDLCSDEDLKRFIFKDNKNSLEKLL